MKTRARPSRSILLLVLWLLLFAALVPLVGGASATATSSRAAADWEEVGGGSASGGGISNSSVNSTRPSLAVASDGTLYVVWREDAGGDKEIYVRRWNGSNWVEVGSGSASGGGISNNSSDSWEPAVAIAPDDTPYVVWHDGPDAAQQIYVRRYSGGSWQEVGSGSASGDGISNASFGALWPAIAVSPNGTPYVAWHDWSTGNAEIYVRRFLGGSWQEVGSGSASGGGISSTDTDSLKPSLAIAPDGTPYVSWHEELSGNSEVYVRRWNGSNWVEVGAGSASGGGISNNSGNSWESAVAVAPDGTPYVVWHDTSFTNQEIYVRRYLGGSWQTVGGGSASDSGVSGTSGDSLWSSIAIAQDGTPYVAWLDWVVGTAQIYVRRYTGGSWQEAGFGSASGNGVSANDTDSRFPAIAVTSGGIAYVTWADGGNQANIYVRRYGGGGEPPSCYRLSRTHTGSGSDPVASPGRSDACPTGEYVAGESISFTADPSDGWRVAGWSGTNNDGSTSLNNSLVMPAANHTVSVAYEQLPPTCYTLTRLHAGSGSDPVASPGRSDTCPTGEYVAGELITLTANPGSGWRVAGWSGTNNDGSTSTSNTLVMPAANHSVSVTYEELPPSCYTLTRSHTGSGSDPVASPSHSDPCGTGRYVEGELITLQANPGSGWRVAGWSGTDNDASTATSNTLVMPGRNHSVEVTYLEETAATCYLLSTGANPSNGGAIARSPQPNCTGGRYTAGTQVQLTANAASGFTFSNWSGDVGGSSNPIVFTVNSNASVMGNFAREQTRIARQYLPMINGLQPPPPFAGTTEREPNNEYAEALGNGWLRSGVRYTGFPNDRTDYFYISVRRPGAIVVIVTNHLVQGGQLLLRDETRRLVGFEPVDSDVLTPKNYRIEYTATQSGDYFVQIHVNTDKPFDATQPYTLTVTYPDS